MESGLTHIQRFLWLSDNVGMFYLPLVQKFQTMIPIDLSSNLDATSTYLFNLCNPRELFHMPKNGM